ncbi:MAG: SDR family oxidoreductase [Rhodospirillales bacterium]|jgi:NAD(P)-dependent dehydrogenase (short-subunit alcohol dehydrogenase family)|nr:SDR family oxidoreductase [Rhodospirillales bacterium]
MLDEFPRAALVTGAALRVGRNIALELAAHGRAVAVHYNTSGDAAAEVVERINDNGGKAVAVQADLMDDGAARALIARAVEGVGPLTCLINNASVFEEDTSDTASRDLWDTHMQVNLRAPFVLSQAFAEQLPRSIEGNIVNLIDQRVLNLTPHFTSYTLSKAALWTLTQTMAMALAPGIRVNAVGPGPTLPSPRQTQEQFIRQWAALPLGRPAEAEEIAETVSFILDAPAMTGQMIALDAGQHLGWRQAAVPDAQDE